MSVAVSAVLLIICIASFVFFCLRGVSPMIVGLCCAIVISFAADGGFLEGFFNVFPSGLVSSVKSILLIFLFASVIGELYNATGFASQMGRIFAAKLPKKMIPYMIVLISALFNLSGIPRRDLIIAAIAYPVLYAADLPIYLGLVCDMGATQIFSWSVTTFPALPNILAGNVFGIEGLTYEPVISWIVTAGGTAVLCLYIWHLLKKAERNHEGYREFGSGLYTMMDKKDEKEEERKIPVLLAFSPIILLVAVSIILSSGLGLDGTSAAIIAQLVTIAFLIVVGYRYMDKNKSLIKSITEAAERACPIVITMGIVAAFAVVVSHTAVYSFLMEKLFTLNATPYVLVIIIVAVLGILTSDGISTLLILGETDIAASLMAAGTASPGILALLSKISAGAFGTMPWSMAAILPMQIYGIVNKDGFIKSLISMVLVPASMLLMTLVLAQFM